MMGGPMGDMRMMGAAGWGAGGPPGGGLVPGTGNMFGSSGIMQGMFPQPEPMSQREELLTKLASIDLTELAASRRIYQSRR